MSDPRCEGGSDCVCGAALSVQFLRGLHDDSNYPDAIQISDSFDNCCEFTIEQARDIRDKLTAVLRKIKNN